MAQGTIRIGISGWTYKPWRGAFYPKGLKQALELDYASSQFASIEINGTFYGTQSSASFARWAETTPEGFVFSIKAPRFITHIRRLREVKAPIAHFLASGILRLGPKLGPILWQFPPSMTFDHELFESFLALLPQNTEAAAALAKQHDGRLKETWAKTDAKRRLRHAVEIRHESFRNPAFIELLRRYKTGLVCADTVEWPRLMDLTSDFVYCRLHGSEQLYASGYDEAALKRWAQLAAAWAKGEDPDKGERVMRAVPQRKSGRDVFMYFDNDIKALAPKNAASLAKTLGLDWESRHISVS